MGAYLKVNKKNGVKKLIAEGAKKFKAQVKSKKYPTKEYSY